MRSVLNSRTVWFGLVLAGGLVLAASAPVRAASGGGGLDVRTVLEEVTPSVVRVYGQRVFKRGSREVQLVKWGSGVVLTSDGFIVTYNGVIPSVGKVQVRTMEDVPIPAKVVLRDAETDLAFIKVDPKGLKAITMGDSDRVRPGQGVLHIGNPFGLARGKNAELSVNHGVVTGVHALNAVSSRYTGQVIQTDAGFNPGGYGGAMVNLKGELIGIAAPVRRSNRTNTDLNIAIPVNKVKKLLAKARDELARPQVKPESVAEETTPKPTVEKPDKNKTTPDIPGGAPGYLGAYVLDEAEGTRGAYIEGVIPGSPADKAGLRRGDLVVEAASEGVTNGGEFLEALSAVGEGETLKITIERDGVRFGLEVTLGKAPRRVLR